MENRVRIELTFNRVAAYTVAIPAPVHNIVFISWISFKKKMIVHPKE